MKENYHESLIFLLISQYASAVAMLLSAGTPIDQINFL